MSAQQRSWECQLLAWAAEGLAHEPPVQAPVQAPTQDARLLDRAYAHCEEIARGQSRTFYKASSLLPAEKRRAVRALYAFCRITDDIIDRAGDDPEAALAAWKERSLAAAPHRRRTTRWCWPGPTRGALPDPDRIRAAVDRRRGARPDDHALCLLRCAGRLLLWGCFDCRPPLHAYHRFCGIRGDPLRRQARPRAPDHQHPAGCARRLGGGPCLPAAGRAGRLWVER